MSLDSVRERMAAYLREQGVPAAAAWPGRERLAREEPVTVVSLRGCQAGPAGFQDYLGEQLDERTGLWEELYGRRVTLTLGLDLYAPPEAPGEQVQRAFDALAQALTRGGPDGLQIQSFSCGETAYDQDSRLLKRPAQAVCTAYLYASARPGETFLDFELWGELKG